MPPRRNKRLPTHPTHLRQILAPKNLPHIPIALRTRLLHLFTFALQRIETQRLVRAHGVQIRAREHEARARDGRAVVDDLVQGVVFVGRAGVEDVEQAVGAGTEE